MAKQLDLNHKISAHLKVSEITCNCGCGFGKAAGDFDTQLAIIFEAIRDAVSAKLGHDTSLYISSGCRCYDWNSAIGGAIDSRHIHGDALDIVCPEEMDYDDFFEICDRFIGHKGGVGYYNIASFVHIDLRGKHVRWIS